MKKIICIAMFLFGFGLSYGLQAQSNNANHTNNGQQASHANANASLPHHQLSRVLDQAAKVFSTEYGIEKSLHEWIRLYHIRQCTIECMAPKTFRVSYGGGVSITILADF